MKLITDKKIKDDFLSIADNEIKKDSVRTSRYKLCLLFNAIAMQNSFDFSTEIRPICREVFSMEPDMALQYLMQYCE